MNPNDVVATIDMIDQLVCIECGPVNKNNPIGQCRVVYRNSEPYCHQKCVACERVVGTIPLTVVETMWLEMLAARPHTLTLVVCPTHGPYLQLRHNEIP